MEVAAVCQLQERQIDAMIKGLLTINRLLPSCPGVTGPIELDGSLHISAPTVKQPPALVPPCKYAEHVGPLGQPALQQLNRFFAPSDRIKRQRQGDRGFLINLRTSRPQPFDHLVELPFLDCESVGRSWPGK